jgi:hypothetical protein
MAAFTRCLTINIRLHPLRQTGHSQTLTRPNQVRLRYGSRVRLARLRVTDYSVPTLARLPCERVIAWVSSFQLTRQARLGLAHRSGDILLATGVSRWLSKGGRYAAL